MAVAVQVAADDAWIARKQDIIRLKGAVGKHDAGLQDKSAVLQEALLLCDNPDRGVRHMALTLVGELGELGHEKCVEAALARVRDNDSRVRTCALQVLGQLANSGDEAVITACSKALQDWHRPARSAALVALRRLVSEIGGSAEAAAAAADLLEDPQSQWRTQVVKVMKHIAVQSDPDTIELVARRLESSRGEVRAAAQDALPALADKGDPLLVEAVLKRLDSEVDYIRVAASQALMRVVSPADPDAASSLALRLEHDVINVRTAASLVLTRFHHRLVRPLVIQRLQHPKAEVRASALAALAPIGRGDIACIKAVGKALQDPVASVRQKAIPVLRGMCVDQGVRANVTAAKVASLALENPDTRVQEIGTMALMSIAEAQNPVQKKKDTFQNKDVSLEDKLEAIRRTQLASLQTTRTKPRKFSDEDSSDEEGLGRISQEEIAVVMSMLERLDGANNAEEETSQEAADAVLDQLSGLAERARDGGGDGDDSSLDGSEEDMNESESEAPSSEEEAEDQPEERISAKSRMQVFVKKAFLGKMATKGKLRRKSTQGIAAQSDASKTIRMSNLQRMSVMDRQDRQAQAWEQVIANMNSGIAKTREHCMKEILSAAGLTVASAAGADTNPVIRTLAKKAMLEAVKSDSSWQVRTTALDAFSKASIEGLADFLIIPSTASSDAMWQVRRAAAKATAKLLVSAKGSCEFNEINDGIEVIEKLVGDWKGDVALEALDALNSTLKVYKEHNKDKEAYFASAFAHQDSRVREKATAILQQRAAHNEVAVAAATAGMLEHEDAAVKEEARKFLKVLGATSVVLDAVTDRISAGSDEQTRCACLRTLMDIAELTDGVQATEDENNIANAAAADIINLGIMDFGAPVRQEAVRCMKRLNAASWHSALAAAEELLAEQELLSEQTCACLRAIAALFANSDLKSMGTGAKAGPAESIEKDDLAHLLDLVASCLENDDPEVQNVSSQVLQDICEHGGRNRTVPAISFVAQRLTNSDKKVQISASHALAGLGGVPKPPKNPPKVNTRRPRWLKGMTMDTKGNPHEAARAASQAMDNKDPAVRSGGSNVLISLAMMSETNVETAAALAVHCLEAEDDGIREDCVDTLVRIGAEGNATVLELVSAHLSSANAMTRRAALQVMEKLSPPGSIGDNDAADLSGESDSIMMRERIARTLSDKVDEVREAAVPAFAQLARPMDKDVVSRTALQLKDAPSAVRRDILASLFLIWSQGRVDAAGPVEAIAVASCVDDESPEVRAWVPRVLEKSKARGNDLVISTVASHLCHKESGVRSAAVQALHAAAEPAGLGYDKGAVAAAAVNLEAQEWDSRKAALKAMLGLLPKSMQHSLGGLESILQAGDEDLWKQQHQVRIELIERICQGHEPENMESGRQLMRHFAVRSLLEDALAQESEETELAYHKMLKSAKAE
mmetsp:Transcript_61907/g.110043  ORF Transcript_61907/g.110043 Transcript_61907/m.110043 type:complete len:1426 (+) Transcript_61907:82-4359(+)|eukprot:CAMPEP_0197621012 /NCGR_PEP_ID=MMETSP1338-20131121/1667_1 /TAXON_ID=43686 ORGANISM="Pelagodinium beii, Strain RCC1491" /NCGR_SAMPLE_ID=MMETSP1338 /ASSEMBLY_ACC=CAM_ASM_000754 /LENGTH=1425 /DNA_ID=CAMNT_0043190331 /DNA_START=64 /DNA_END=4341 /DNA_ORIENTATION=-